MKKIFLLLALFVAFFSCQDITELDVNPKQATTVDEGSLFANAQKNVVDFLASPSVNSNIFRLLAQQWTETTYIDESNYDLATRNIPQNVWYILYRDVLKDLKEAKKLVEADLITSAGVKKNQIAQIDIMEVYTWSLLVNTFGDIPYTQALDFNILQPAYDDDAAIYSDLMTKLNGALGALDNGEETFGDFDLLYGGDVDSWSKFGNSIKLKLGMTIADANAAAAKTAVEQAVAAGVFTSNDDNAVFSYLDAPPNTNPIWVDLVQSGRKDFVAANTIVNKMLAINDPRIPFYFTEDSKGGYSGGIYGSSNNFSTFSKPSEILTAPDFQSVIMDYSEVEFYLAEAVERNFAVGGTAQTHYNKAITASMEYWGVSGGDISDFLLQPSVNYATATGSFKQKIGTQKWIALYNRGFEAWTEWRRLDFPILVAPPEAVSAIPTRYTYPASEQNLNKANYTSATTAMGGDNVTSKIFWDKN